MRLHVQANGQVCVACSLMHSAYKHGSHKVCTSQGLVLSVFVILSVKPSFGESAGEVLCPGRGGGNTNFFLCFFFHFSKFVISEFLLRFPPFFNFRRKIFDFENFCILDTIVPRTFFQSLFAFFDVFF